MAQDRYGEALRQVDALFADGASGALTDGQLLDRFAAGGGEAGGRAFAALVERHGPIVLRACRAALRDPADIQDAFQATFLVLARKAGSIRRRDSVAPWLLGVARRIAARARSDAARRRRHETRAAARGEPSTEGAPADDLAPAIHEELARLPHRDLAPIALCYFEGLTHEQAAQRLGWPVGTVRSRLARARDRLRDRLVRRGLAPSAAMLGAGLAADAATARAALHFTANAPPAPGIGSASPAVLARGVLKEMTMTRLKLIAACLLPAGLLATGPILRVRRADGFQQPSSPPRHEAHLAPTLPKGGPTPNADKAVEVEPTPRTVEEALEARVRVARRGLETACAFYEEGRTGYSIEDYFTWSKRLLGAEVARADRGDPSKSRAARIAAAEGHRDRIKATEDWVRSELEMGRGTSVDLRAAQYERIEAEGLVLEYRRDGTRRENPER